MASYLEKIYMPAAGANFFGNFENVPVGEFEKKIPVHSVNRNYMALFEKHSNSNHGVFLEYSKLNLSFILSKYEI